MIFIPLRTDSPLRSTPYMNWLLIAANCVVFAITTAKPELSAHYALHPRSPKLIEFFTYQFLHANVMHIAGNMLFLYIFGNNVNDKMGNVGYLAFYLAGGIIAGLCFMETEATATGLVGASGAIAAVSGAYLILFPRSLITIFYWLFITFGRIEIQSLWFILAFFALDVFGNFAQQDGVAHMAHIGGTIFGSLTCLGLVVTHLLPRDQWDVWALIQRWNKRRQYRDMVSKGYNPFDYSDAVKADKRKPPNPNAARIQELRDNINAALSARQIVAATDQYLELCRLDDQQVFSRQAQLDLATQLHHDGRYPEAAAAYEKLLKTYPNVERVEQVELMVGIVYSRYLHNFDEAKRHLSKAISRLHEGRELELAKDELASIESQSSVGVPPTSN